MDYSIREYAPGDEEEILEILNLAFGRWPSYNLSCSPIDHWRWKFLDSPLKSIVVVAESGERMIGCHHDCSLLLRMGEEVLRCNRGTGAAVHPEFQGRGVYTKMANFRDELQSKNGVDLSYHSATNPIMVGRAIRTGQVPFPNKVLNMFLIKDIKIHMKMNVKKKSLLKRYAFPAIKAVNRILNRRMLTHSNSDIRVSEVHKFDETFDDFWKGIHNFFGFSIERDGEYMSWRYCDKRAGEFIIKKAEENGEVVGYNVLRINTIRPDYPVGYIVDFLVNPERSDVADALIKDSVNFFESREINDVNYMVLSDNPFIRLFSAYGFLKSEEKSLLILNPKNQRGKDAIDRFRTLKYRSHFQYGDTDMI